jgi:hypothetical protein
MVFFFVFSKHIYAQCKKNLAGIRYLKLEDKVYSSGKNKHEFYLP